MKRKCIKIQKKIFEDLEINIDPRIKVEKLSVSQMQKLERIHLFVHSFQE